MHFHSESKPDRKLRLQWISHAHAQEAIKLNSAGDVFFVQLCQLLPSSLFEIPFRSSLLLRHHSFGQCLQRKHTGDEILRKLDFQTQDIVLLIALTYLLRRGVSNVAEGVQEQIAKRKASASDTPPAAAPVAQAVRQDDSSIN